jgi:hypothetical protein
LVELAWLSPSRLLVRYDASARVFRRKETVYRVEVRFELVDLKLRTCAEQA